MTDSDAGSPMVLARAVGLFGAVGVGSLCLWAISAGVALLLQPVEQRGLLDGLHLLGLLAFLPIVLFGLVVAIQALRDALRHATGGPALRLGSACLFLFALAALQAAEVAEDAPARLTAALVWPGVLAGLTICNFGAYVAFRRAGR